MNIKVIGIIVAAIAILAIFSTFSVHETERGILFRLGEIKQADLSKGLHFKFPFVNNVRKFEGRVRTLDAQPERFLTARKKNVEVDFFVVWQIGDVSQYYRSVRGNAQNARSRLSQIVKDDLRNEFGKRTIQEAVSGERSVIMKTLRIKTNEIANQLGIDVVDVRISRIDLPDQVSESVYDRMRSERERLAKELRARGKEEAERIRAEADRKRTVILANAYRDGEKTRGQGDAKATDIYAQAFGDDSEFYTFYRSLNAYKQTFKGKNDMLVIDPKSEFFRYFDDASGGDSAGGPGEKANSNNAAGNQSKSGNNGPGIGSGRVAPGQLPGR